MRVIRVADYKEMSLRAGEYLVERVRSNPALTLGLATGSTPEGLYSYLIKDHQENGTSYKKINSINLDEYVGIKQEDPNSYHYFMREHFFDHVDIDLANTHVPDGAATDLAAECENYEQLIKSVGGVDLQVLGIGQNGHIGFNEPGSSFGCRTHVVKLAENTREANSRFFDSLEDVPTHALTMGIGSILDSKEILLLASGEGKADAIARLLTEGISESFPASALKNHQNVTIFADESALKVYDEINRMKEA
jgi:glucosamine-6-phosphate deaminase